MGDPRADDSAREKELAAVEADIAEMSERRFSLPGGIGDAILRNHLEDLQVKANQLSAELGRPAVYASLPSSSDGGSPRLRARLDAIYRELRVLSQFPGTPNDVPFERRELLEKEAAAIRAVLDAEDPRPGVRHSPHRGGWLTLFGAVILIVLALVVSSHLL